MIDTAFSKIDNKMQAISSNVDNLQVEINEVIRLLAVKCLCGSKATRNVVMRHPTEGRWNQMCCESCDPFDIYKDGKSVRAI